MFLSSLACRTIEALAHSSSERANHRTIELLNYRITINYRTTTDSSHLAAAKVTSASSALRPQDFAIFKLAIPLVKIQ